MVRARLARHGVADPLRLSSMHVILDVVEDMLRESCSKPEDWERLQMQLYAPSKGEEVEGWSGAEQVAAFDSFMSALG